MIGAPTREPQRQKEDAGEECMKQKKTLTESEKEEAVQQEAEGEKNPTTTTD